MQHTQQCDPNFSGACVPIASDVDCAGGSGNGPAYVQGPVQVVGTDIYGFDRDGDGIGCEDGVVVSALETVKPSPEHGLTVVDDGDLPGSLHRLTF